MQFKPGEKFFQAVLNLQASQDFVDIKKELEAYHLDAGLRFPSVDGVPLVKLQGRTALVLELLTSMDPAYALAQLESIKMSQVMEEKKIPF